MPVLDTESLLALVTLSAMEIVLGIDNIIFLAILVAKLPEPKRPKARRLGLIFALATRLLLLLSITWVMGLTRPLFAILGKGFTGRDLILLLGGMFLVAKATFEIHDKLEAGGPETSPEAQLASGVAPAIGRGFVATLIQIAVLDIVFSLDSVITAVGMAQQLWIMVVAMFIAVGVMLVSSAGISDFVERHPTIKILALSFLILIGVVLVVEGMGGHVSKGYIYFAMTFALGVEILNLRFRRRQQPIKLLGAKAPSVAQAPRQKT